MVSMCEYGKIFRGEVEKHIVNFFVKRPVYRRVIFLHEWFIDARIEVKGHIQEIDLELASIVTAMPLSLKTLQTFSSLFQSVCWLQC